MARYRYLGEAPYPNMVQTMGNTLSIRLRLKDGTRAQIDAPNQEVGFVVGSDLGIDISDPRVIRHLDADPRFEKIV